MLLRRQRNGIQTAAVGAAIKGINGDIPQHPGNLRGICHALGRQGTGAVIPMGKLRLAVPDGDSAELRGLTFSSRAIRELLDRLMRCDVTPISLHDIVEDWLISECHS